MTDKDPGWVAEACTLPTAERPLRLAEFDELFTTAVHDVEVLDPTRVRMRLAGPAGLAATVRDLAARESECCSFFTFTIGTGPAGDGAAVVLDIEVPPAYAEVLDSLAQRASALSTGVRR
jgi:hypothetical protein